ncbi:glycine-rich domain-containing protein-like [Patescibacteria group bacterium]|nr:glycine-rich domain-containing protein-like [Patescibacteria group bacterium]
MHTRTEGQVSHLALLAPTPVAALPTFSLAAVMSKVVRNNPDWSLERLRDAEAGYRNYLAQILGNPTTDMSPTPDVDEVWHTHILHTQQYHADCAAYFGYYLHHVPATLAGTTCFKANGDAQELTCGPGGGCSQKVVAGSC